MVLATVVLVAESASAQSTPLVNWIRQLGTAGEDKGNRVSADGLGGVYIAGDTAGLLGEASTGNQDAFVAKYDVAGNRLWTRQFGATDGWYEGAWGISADKLGNVFVSGWGWGSLGGPNPNPGYTDAFVTKFDTGGSKAWVRPISTSYGDLTFGISADGQGNAYVSGHTQGSLGDTNVGGYDAYVSKYDASGNRLWMKQIGTTTDDSCRDVSADALGNVYIGGYTGGSLAGTNAGSTDVFVAKYDVAGNQSWTRQFGTASNDEGWGISADKLGNVFIGGATKGSLGGPNAGGWDAFVGKYDAAGDLVWTRQFGTSSDDRIWRISADSKGNIYVAGATTGSLAGPAPDPGYWDAFVSKFEADGNQLWTIQLGTRSFDNGGWGLSADELGNVYLSGCTYGSLDGSNAGGLDAFVASISDVPEPSTLVLLAAGALGFLGWAWRRRRA
jgi:hypothetical protein